LKACAGETTDSGARAAPPPPQALYCAIPASQGTDVAAAELALSERLWRVWDWRDARAPEARASAARPGVARALAAAAAAAAPVPEPKPQQLRRR